MRIKITMETIGRQVMDINYNYYLSSLIYSFLKKSNEKYSDFLHNEGYEANRKNYKMFTFSMLKPGRYRIEGHSIEIEGKVVWYVASPMKEFLMYLVDCLASSPGIRIGRGEFRITELEVTPEPEYKSSMKFRCLSPVTVSTAYLEDDSKLKKIDLYIEDRKFIENLKSNILSKYRIIYGEEPENKDFEVEFIDIEKYKKGKLITYKDNIRVKGYLAPLKITGNPELIETAYECGLGDRNSLGMGMIEVY